jgi:hypothetical protein
MFAPEVQTAERPAHQQGGGGASPTPALLRRRDWWVRSVSLETAQEAISRLHYSKGGSNTATYRFGLFRRGEELMDAWCLGVAWFIPPTKSAALATFPENWQGVLTLTRFVIDPTVPKNAASFLLAKATKLIDRGTWPCLVTYADEWQGHTGTIYRAAGWEYVGMTQPEATFVRAGRMVARKAGPKTRTHAEMKAMGAEMVGKFAKHKFVNISRTVLSERVAPSEGQA